jgi:16S rRNA (guanine527-N7)-methyltransferase
MSPPLPIERLEQRLTIAGVGVELTTESRQSIATWLDLLKTWNARIDLTAAKTDDDLVELMLADALVLAARIPRGVSVVDIGSGAGAPAMALALARPDLRVTMIEPLGKRVSFLRTVLGTVGRTDVRLESARGEDAIRRGETWDVAISRATLAPPEWLAMGARLVGRPGSVWVLVANDEPPTHEGASLAEVVMYEKPLAEGAAPRKAFRYDFFG